MRAMTENEQRAHAIHVLAVRQALGALERLPDEVLVQESVAIARARLADWLDDHAGRWVA